jgi:predicted XRE-type DNA-binding protein
VAIYTALADSDVPRRPRGQQPRSLSAEICTQIEDLYRTKKLTQAQLAIKFKCHQTQISRILKKANLLTKRQAENHGSWKGGRVVTKEGYVLIKTETPVAFYSMINSGGYFVEHRLVVALALGRPLLKTEQVHHINGNKADNRLENLQLMFTNHGAGVKLRCHVCGSENIDTVSLDMEGELSVPL